MSKIGFDNKKRKYEIKLKKVFTLVFCFSLLELLVGIYSNSLGLVSDSIHMMFDSSTIVLSYICLILENKKSSNKFSYRLKKIEYIASFMNSLCLIFISINIIKKSLSRWYNPEKINGNKTLFISVVGVTINILGLFYFKEDFHSCMGHDHTHNHSHNHSHTHVHDNKFNNTMLENNNKDNTLFEGNDTLETENNVKNATKQNLNINSIIIHLIGDLLGSISLIISSILIIFFNYYKFDSIASIFIAILILYNSIKIIIKSYNNLNINIVEDHMYFEIRQLSSFIKNNDIMEHIDNYFLKDSFTYGSNKYITLLNIIPKENANLSNLTKEVKKWIFEFKRKSIYMKDAFINYSNYF